MKRLIAELLAIVMFLLAGCSVATTKEKNISWHQCPQLGRRYIAYAEEHPYQSDDYSYTYINDFAPATADQANAKPVSKTIDDTVFCNIEPNKAIPLSDDEKSGTLITFDKLRWFGTTIAEADGNPYQRGYNCRDLGGWTCDGGTIKYGMLVRSGEINAADKELMVNQIGIKTEVNLLPAKLQASKSSVWGIEWVGNPTDTDFMYKIDDSVKKQWKLYLQTIFKSTAANKPVLFHCGAGADKTGTMSVMLMGILGCPLHVIDIDYELTNFSIYADWRNRTFPSYVNYIKAIQALPTAKGLPDSFQNKCISYALSLGISIDDINAFRAACIDGTPEVIKTEQKSK